MKWEVAKMGGGISSSLETIVMVAKSRAGKPETSFLDFWSISSALYGADEGPKDAEAASTSCKPSSAP